MTSTPRRSAPLSTSELRVINTIADDNTIDDAAAALRLSKWTVKSQLHSAYVKLGVRDTGALVGAAILTGNLVVKSVGQVPSGFDRPAWEVTVRIARGRNNREIIDELGLNKRQLQAAVRDLLAMFQVKTRAGLVVAAVACGALRLVPAGHPENVSRPGNVRSGLQSAPQGTADLAGRATGAGHREGRPRATAGPSRPAPTNPATAKPLPRADVPRATATRTLS